MSAGLAAVPLLLLAATATLEAPAAPKDQDKWVELDQLEFGPDEGRRTTHYRLDVTDRGRARTCHVLRSSGDELFDKSLCEQLKRNARFERATSTMFQSGTRSYSGYFTTDLRG